jgi:hypothetical protein
MHQHAVLLSSGTKPGCPSSSTFTRAPVEDAASRNAIPTPGTLLVQTRFTRAPHQMSEPKAVECHPIRQESGRQRSPRAICSVLASVLSSGSILSLSKGQMIALRDRHVLKEDSELFYILLASSTPCTGVSAANLNLRCFRTRLCANNAH